MSKLLKCHAVSLHRTF